MTLSFDKYHGIGNDFLVVSVEEPTALTVERAVALCDRHFGVGADGVLMVSPATTSGARAKMTVINADGSTPEMCGNGLRCVALHLTRTSKDDSARFLIDTDAGPLLCEVESEGDQGMVTTGLGAGTPLGSFDFTFEGQTYAFHRISTGNPHAICFRPQLSPDLLDRLGPAVSGSLPTGANVEIATVTSRTSIQVSVWERGVGRTLACGTGAAATAIAAVNNDLCAVEVPVAVSLPGGLVHITVSPEKNTTLRGPAAWIYSGATGL